MAIDTTVRAPEEQFEHAEPDGRDCAAAGLLTNAVPPGWDVERIVSLLAGSFTLFSLSMARLHHRRWRLMTTMIGTNLILQAVAGWCPASLALRKLGVPVRGR